MPPSPGYVRGPLVVPQTCEVRLLWQFPSGKLGSNVLHAIVPDGFEFTQPDVDDVFNGIVASPGWGELHPFLAATTRILGLEIKDLRAANLAGVPSSAVAADGTSGSDAYPSSVALAVSLKTAQAGRSFRGRTYLGGWAENAGDADGAATDPARAAALDFMNDVRASMIAKNFELAIAHRGHADYLSPATGLTVPAEAAGSVPVTAITVIDSIFDSQRRRK